MLLTSIVVSSLTVVLTNANYHSRIGIPAAARIRDRETRSILGLPDEGLESRIANGEEVPVGTYPWLAGLVISIEKEGKYYTSVCGSSLVSQNRLVTAGHCWTSWENNTWIQASSMEVVLASKYLFHGGLRIKTDNVITHPKWNKENPVLEYDAAVIYLPFSVTFDDNISPINLPSDYIEESFEGYLAFAAGYGILDDVQFKMGFVFNNASIHHVGLKVITNAECSRYHKWEFYMNSCWICTSGIDHSGICPGDSGSTLMTYVETSENNKIPILIGISSRGSPYGCELGYPSIFTRVTQILDFIYAHIQE